MGHGASLQIDGESIGFAVDMDPNSIAGATKSTANTTQNGDSGQNFKLSYNNYCAVTQDFGTHHID